MTGVQSGIKIEDKGLSYHFSQGHFEFKMSLIS